MAYFPCGLRRITKHPIKSDRKERLKPAGRASARKLSPAYDLTYRNSIGGEHATCVNGSGQDPGRAEVLAVADKIGISKPQAKRIAQQVQDMAADKLGDGLRSAGGG